MLNKTILFQKIYRSIMKLNQKPSPQKKTTPTTKVMMKDDQSQWTKTGQAEKRQEFKVIVHRWSRVAR